MGDNGIDVMRDAVLKGVDGGFTSYLEVHVLNNNSRVRVI